MEKRAFCLKCEKLAHKIFQVRNLCSKWEMLNDQSRKIYAPQQWVMLWIIVAITVLEMYIAFFRVRLVDDLQRILKLIEVFVFENEAESTHLSNIYEWDAFGMVRVLRRFNIAIYFKHDASRIQSKYSNFQLNYSHFATDHRYFNLLQQLHNGISLSLRFNYEYYLLHPQIFPL